MLTGEGAPEAAPKRQVLRGSIFLLYFSVVTRDLSHTSDKQEDAAKLSDASPYNVRSRPVRRVCCGSSSAMAFALRELCRQIGQKL